MTSIIINAAALVPALSLSKKKSGNPIRRATEKHISCRFVRLRATFVLTLVKSLGTGTYAIKSLLLGIKKERFWRSFQAVCNIKLIWFNIIVRNIFPCVAFS